MKKHLLIALALSTALSGPVLAESAPGWYAGVQGGVTFPENLFTQRTSGAGSYTLNPKTGWAGGVFAGYDFLGPRIELEGGYRHSNIGHVDATAAAGDVHVWSGMVNLMYDFNQGGRLKPYIGVGGGMARVSVRNVAPLPIGGVLNDNDRVLAYQGIVGVRYDLNDSWALRLDGRYFATQDPEYIDAAGASVKSEYKDATVMLGIVYKFGQPAAAPQTVAYVQPQPSETMTTTTQSAPIVAPTVNAGPFLVFFDWDSADVTGDADKILQDAASAAKQGHPVSIILSGHADRSGSSAYNMGLSQRRADAVKATLAKWGVDSAITTKAFGETEPLVATADGVREPQNRRVEIIFPKQ